MVSALAPFTEDWPCVFFEMSPKDSVLYLRREVQPHGDTTFDISSVYISILLDMF